MRVGIFYSRLRVEEKALTRALEDRGAAVQRLDVRRLALPLEGAGLSGYDAFLVRCISHTQAVYVSRLAETWGQPVVNPSAVIQTCGDKLLASVALVEAGCPPPGRRWPSRPKGHFRPSRIWDTRWCSSQRTAPGAGFWPG